MTTVLDLSAPASMPESARYVPLRAPDLATLLHAALRNALAAEELVPRDHADPVYVSVVKVRQAAEAALEELGPGSDAEHERRGVGYIVEEASGLVLGREEALA